MGSLLNRYRSLTALLLLLLAQLILVAYQVHTARDVRLLRVWTVSAVTPLARLLDSASGVASGFLKDYVLLAGVERENRKLAEEVDRLKMENRFLRSELATAERAQALGAFQARTPSRTVAARVIGVGPSVDSRVLLVDRGTSSGVRAGMAVIRPDGIVGKVTAAYPSTAHVLLVTDPRFAAGVISGKNKVQGTLRGTRGALCRVDYLQNEETVEPGEWFYTSGDDLLFPRGLPVGPVKTVAAGRTFKEVLVEPSGLGGGVEEVLIVLEGVHQPIPEPQAQVETAPLLPPPPVEGGGAPAAAPATGVAAPETDADRVVDAYRKSAAESGRAYGDNVQPAKPPGATGAGSAPSSRPPGAAPPKPAAATGAARP